MMHIQRQGPIGSADAETLFAILSDPHELSRLLPRLRKVEREEFRDNGARFALCMAVGSMLGTICFEGILLWVESNEIVLVVRNSMHAEIHWTLRPGSTGNELHVSAQVDLRPLLGPMTSFLPLTPIYQVIGNEIDHALAELAMRFEGAEFEATCAASSQALVA